MENVAAGALSYDGSVERTITKSEWSRTREMTQTLGKMISSVCLCTGLLGTGKGITARMRTVDSRRAATYTTPKAKTPINSHFCLGANLAKIEARIALETILPRIPEWTVDYEHAALTKGIDTRGWETLPVTVS